MLTPIENAQIDAALGLLRQQKIAEALAELKTLHEAGLHDERVQLSLAVAARFLGDFETCLGAANTLLATDGGHVLGHILRGDALKAAGQEQAAIAAYMAATKAVPANAQLDANTRTEVERARAECAKAASLYESWLRAYLKDRVGADMLNKRTRTGLALEIVFGAAQVYHQQPTHFYVPHLPQRAFFDRSEFDWADQIEAATRSIEAEYAALAADESQFRAYVTSDGQEPKLQRTGLTNNLDWSAIHLIKSGVPDQAIIAKCKETMAALAGAPVPDAGSFSPVTLFSRLRPGMHIPPHHGMTNTRLICHLPLIIPKGCTLRVGGETRGWTPGQLLVFDDTIEHEAFNPSNEDRSVLIFDIWRPELAEDERIFVKAMFSGIDAFGQQV